MNTEEIIEIMKTNLILQPQHIALNQKIIDDLEELEELRRLIDMLVGGMSNKRKGKNEN